MPYDYTDAPPPQFELIPHGTTATTVLHIRAGDVGEDGMLKRSKDGGCEMLDCEFTVVDGPYKGRKFWERMILAGITDGHAKSAEINRGTLKAILDSALGLKPESMGLSGQGSFRPTRSTRTAEPRCTARKAHPPRSEQALRNGFT